MAREGRVTVAEIDGARAKIVDLLLDQCEHGQQTTALSDKALASCGQFIGEGAKNLPQRGLHGTAAAIAVFANVLQKNQKARDLLPRLVRYAADRETVEEKVGPGLGLKHAEVDSDNVIKISELLVALAAVPGASVANTNNLKQELTKLIKTSLVEDRGWGYFRSEPSVGPQLLPTAYAVMALDAVNEDVSKPIQYMLEQLRAATGGEVSDTDADVTIRTLALYAIAFPKNAQQRPHIERRVQIELFDGLWQRLEPLLRTESIEQNAEYWRLSTRRTYYVRVPWQLYLLALSARVRTRRFAGKAAQARMRDIVSSMTKGQFRYPHSGKMISSRANAIAYEVLGHARSEMERSGIFGAYVWLDRARSWGGWRYGAFLFATALTGLSLWMWLANEGAKQLIDLAPNFFSSLVIYILLWSRRR